MKIIGLDVGTKRIGLARADSSVRIATPAGFMIVDGTEWEQLARLTRIHGTKLFVVGLPRSNDGNETKQSLYVRQFAKTLVEKIPGAKVRFQDESLTSVEAEERLKSRQKKYERGEIDAEAATIILQDFLESITGGSVDAPVETTVTHSETQARVGLGKHKTGEVKKRAHHAKIAPRSAKKPSRKIFLLGAMLLLALLGVSGFLTIKAMRARERAKYYAEKEAEMQAATFDFTVRPGETIFDIKRNLMTLDRNGGREQAEPIPNYTEEEIDAAFRAEYGFSFLADRPDGASLEGYLYPETHNFYSDASVEDVLKVFLSGMEAAIQENNLAQRYEAQGLTLFEGITLASVVQKEATPGEQPTVAQVFLLRNRYGWNLGSDASVTYALDVLNPNREPHNDNQSALMVDSCYNTRLYAGLPCGPISNPGLSSLLAVAAPSDTSYLFFLTGDDGLMYYSYTEAEHYHNRDLYCQSLCNISL